MFQSGERDVPLMTAQLIGKSAQDLEDLAAYYASLPGKIGEAVGSDEDIKTARMIYRRYCRPRCAACAACHGPGGLGNGQAGSIAGWPVSSLYGRSANCISRGPAG